MRRAHSGTGFLGVCTGGEYPPVGRAKPRAPWIVALGKKTEGPPFKRVVFFLKKPLQGNVVSYKTQVLDLQSVSSNGIPQT
jgi:hypothetical protein